MNAIIGPLHLTIDINRKGRYHNGRELVVIVAWGGRDMLINSRTGIGVTLGYWSPRK